MFYLEIFLLCLSWVQPWDGQQCAARGGEIWLQLTGMICPCTGNLTTNFWKMSNPHPMPLKRVVEGENYHYPTMEL